MARKRLGELLLERGTISHAQLEAALATQRTTRARLGAILIEQGVLSEAALVQALSRGLGIPQVDLTEIQPEWSAVHSLRARFCDQHELFPFALEVPRGGGRKHLSVAVADPLNVPAIEEIEFTTGLKVVVHLAPRSAVRTAILRWYHKVDPGQVPGQIVRPGGAAMFEDDSDTTISSGEPLPADWTPEEDSVPAIAPLVPPRAPAPSALDRDLAYLVGSTEVEPVEELERKFWALLRIMSRKGLLTAEEFKKELEVD